MGEEVKSSKFDRICHISPNLVGMLQTFQAPGLGVSLSREDELGALGKKTSSAAAFAA